MRERLRADSAIQLRGLAARVQPYPTEVGPKAWLHKSVRAGGQRTAAAGAQPRLEISPRLKTPQRVGRHALHQGLGLNFVFFFGGALAERRNGGHQPQANQPISLVFRVASKL